MIRIDMSELHGKAQCLAIDRARHRGTSATRKGRPAYGAGAASTRISVVLFRRIEKGRIRMYSTSCLQISGRRTALPTAKGPHGGFSQHRSGDDEQRSASSAIFELSSRDPGACPERSDGSAACGVSSGIHSTGSMRFVIFKSALARNSWNALSACFSRASKRFSPNANNHAGNLLEPAKESSLERRPLRTRAYRPRGGPLRAPLFNA